MIQSQHSIKKKKRRERKKSGQNIFLQICFQTKSDLTYKQWSYASPEGGPQAHIICAFLPSSGIVQKTPTDVFPTQHSCLPRRVEEGEMTLDVSVSCCQTQAASFWREKKQYLDV